MAALAGGAHFGRAVGGIERQPKWTSCLSMALLLLLLLLETVNPPFFRHASLPLRFFGAAPQKM